MTGNKTAKDILIEYLASKKYADNITISSHEIEEDVRKFGRHYYNKLHNASTYSRVWRTLKESGKIPELDVIKIITIARNTKNGTLENRWVLQTIS